jgi:signal transduction histidine kinase
VAHALSSDRLLLATARIAAQLQRGSAIDVVPELLRDLGEATGVDRAYLVECHGLAADGEPAVSRCFEWVGTGIEARMSAALLAEAQPAWADFARWLERMRQEGEICGPPSEFPASERDFLARYGVQSLLAVGVPGTDGMHGFLAFDACRAVRLWSETERRVLGLVAAALGSAIDRERALDAARAARSELEEEARVSAGIVSFARQTLARLRDPALGETVCARIAELLGCDASFAIVWCEEEQASLVVGSHGLPAAAREVLALVRAPRSQTAHFADVFTLDDVAVARGPSKQFAGLGLNADVTWRIRLALRREGELVGVISAFKRNRTDGFREADVRLARGLAQVTSLAVESARLLSRLDRASRLESRFVANMSHELRTPLNVLIGYLEMLGDGGVGVLNEGQHGVVDRALRSAQGLAGIVQGGLDLGRIQAGQAPLVPADVALEPMLVQAVAIFRDRWHRKGLAVSVDVAPDAARLRSDPAKLDAVVRSLVGNAVKFTPRGNVLVGARRQGDSVEISVQDTGVGIPSEALSQIFEPFRQLDPAENAGGVGLGLTIAERLVGLLGGRIEVESEVGRGSRFRVVVPDLAAARAS